MGARWVLLSFSLAALGCGGRSLAGHETSQDVPVDDAGLPADEAGARDCGGLYEFDCPEGFHCFGPPTCGAPWSCREGIAPCSAAPPISVCGCDGLVGAVPAGCLERYAWRLEGLPPAEDGAPCDATLSEPPVSITLSIELRGFDAFREYRVRLEDGTDRPGILENGVASIVFNAVPTTRQVPRIDVFAGRSNDPATCIDGVDRVGFAFPIHFDALSMVATYEVEPDDLAYRCKDWDLL